MPASQTTTQVDTLGVAIAADGADHWFALTSTGSALKYYVDGTLIDSFSFDMRQFRERTLEDMIGLRDTDTASSLVTYAKQERIWQRALSLSELSFEAASATPVSTTALISNTGLATISDLTDTVSGHVFSVESGTGGTDDSGGYIRFNNFNDNIYRSAPWFDASRAFTIFFHSKITGTHVPPAYHNLRWLMSSHAFAAPYIWFGNEPDTGQSYIVQIVVLGTTDAPELPIDTSEECCCTCDGGGGGGNTGPILPTVDPGWTPSCTGAGAVPTAADLTTAEDWSA